MPMRLLNRLLIGFSFFACSSVFAVPLTVDLAGIPSYGMRGDAANTVLTFNVGANATITSVTYDFTLTAFLPSFLSEMELALTDSAQSTGVMFTPAPGNRFPGSASFSGTADLVALGLAFNVGADGVLRLEFYETLNDTAIAPDGRWDGVLTFGVNGNAETDVPEPATGMLMGAGLAAMAYAARRRQARSC